MNESPGNLIACGMYAFNHQLKRYWRSLFTRFHELLGDDHPLDLRLDPDEGLLHQPSLLFGHTCGYPLMTRLKDQLTPFCLPLFDVPGTDGKYYSSRFIVAADSDAGSLADCRGKVAAINNPDSNSGMNVFRHAISKLNPPARFFADVIETGGHFHSLEAVANGQADIAAIDCVSFQLIEDEYPEMTRRVRSIGFSEKTCGLPFVMPNRFLDSNHPRDWLSKLNQALALCPPEVHSRLHLKGFEAVDFSDYRGILALEEAACRQGYPALQ